MALSTRARAHLAMIFVSCTFSLWNVLGEIVLQDGSGDPVIFALYREVLTAFVLVVGTVLRQHARQEAVKRPTLREAALFCVCGIGGVYCLQLFYILGLSLTSANEGALFQPLTPVLVLVLAAILGLERLRLWPLTGDALVRASWQKLCGVVSAVGGCLLVVLAAPAHNSEGSSGESRADPLGALYLFLSILGAATFLLSQKPLLRTYDPTVVIAGSYAVGALCMAVTAAIWKGDDAAAWAMSSTEVTCPIAFDTSQTPYALRPARTSRPIADAAAAACAPFGRRRP